MASTGMCGRWIKASAVALALALTATACGGGGSDSDDASGEGEAGEITPGGKVIYGLEAETADGWCLPEAQLAISGIQVVRSVYDTLTRPNAEGEYEPWLAESVEPNADFTQWTITVRDGVTFHDGSALDATVVKNNLDAYRGSYPGRNPLLFRFTFSNIASVEVVDPKTVMVTTTVPWTAFDAYLYGSGRVGMMAQAQLDNATSCADDPIGTGPFVFDEWVPNQKFVATKNADYWATDAAGNPLPYLDEIEYRPIVEGAQRVNALDSGDITAMHTSDPALIAPLRDQAESGEINLTESIDFGEVSYVMLNASKPPFDNVKARQALAYAFNFDDYNAIRGKGILTRATGPFAPGSVGNLEETDLPGYDLDEAKRLVAEYEEETGQALQFSYTTTQAESTLADAQFWQQAAADAGMELEIVTVDQSTQIDTAISGDFEAIGWRNHPGGDPDEQFVWWESTYPTNFGRIKDPEIDSLLNDGRSNPDQDARVTIYEDLNKRFGQEVYNIWNYYTIWGVATAPDVHGVLGEGPTDAEPFPGLAVGISPAYLWVEQ